VIRSVLTILFWGIVTPLAALVLFPWTLLTGNPLPMYRVGNWIAWTGVRLAGVRVEVIGREKLDAARTYIFMSNHASNLDPPLLIPLIPRRTSVLVKKELFRVPVLGRAMRLASLVPVDRTNRQRAIDSLQKAHEVLRAGINMTVFVEGTRSPDGRLLPFKKGPFHLALETGFPVVPVTLVGTHELLPKGKLLARPGTVQIVFHAPLEPSRAAGRDALMSEVRDAIAGALPPETSGTGDLAIRPT
jgi:1-acyl-sn-glycerol-3-phosphate acyltransferase